tara:strand:- start:4631 stop:5632 length:1002 start_codon:yes stop_codon:yes gene_type:complete
MDFLINKSEKIFLAGANGMVGSSIKRTLQKYDYGLKKYDGKLLTPTRNELNLLDYSSVYSWMEKNSPTIVIIAAAKVGGILANSYFPGDFLLENLKIQTNIIDSSWKLGVKRLLFLGSSCIYPKYANQPISEEELLNGSLEETNQWYAISKISGIKLCESLRKQYGFDAISLMPTNLYGPNDNYHPQNSHVLPALINRFKNAKESNLNAVTCWGTGNALREFLYVDDLAEAVIFCLRNWDPSSSKAPKDNKGNALNFLNVGTGLEISIKDLAHKISKKIGFKGEVLWDISKPDGTPRKLLNIKKISELGWKPKYDLDKGLEKTLINLKNKMIF